MIDLDDKIKTAMKAKDAVALTAYRSLKQHVMRKLNETSRPGDQALTEDELAGLIKKEIKERTEANSFLKAGHPTFDENAQIVTILETHLPKAMGAEQLEAVVQKAIADAAAAGPKDFGKVMGALKKAGGGIDMAAASARAKAILEAKGT